ncbi:hypothetical protein FB451DRAFT_1507892 [Mycena latifolia]|nr:hypothetical protein FB451DRAFT_1507892 [Mycena latifolia]
MPYNHIYSYKKLRLTSNVGTLVLSCSNLSAVRSRIWYHKLRAQQLAGAAVENDSLKRPARATGRDKTKDKTLNALEAKRKAKDKKKRTSPKQRSSSAMDMEMSESDSEDGQISKVDQEDERLFGKLKSAAEPAFEKIVTSTWVRYLIGTNPDTNPDNMPVYRIYQIKGLSLAGQGTAAERSRLIAQRTLAQRRHDYNEAGTIDTQLAMLPEARQRRKRREAVHRSEVLEVERKCPERKNRVGGVPAVVDSSAQLRTIPQLFESATPTSRSFMQTGDAEPAALGVAPPLPKKGLSPSPAKTSIPSRSISGTFKCVYVLPASYELSIVHSLDQVLQTKTGNFATTQDGPQPADPVNIPVVRWTRAHFVRLRNPRQIARASHEECCCRPRKEPGALSDDSWTSTRDLDYEMPLVHRGAHYADECKHRPFCWSWPSVGITSVLIAWLACRILARQTVHAPGYHRTIHDIYLKECRPRCAISVPLATYNCKDYMPKLTDIEGFARHVKLDSMRIPLGMVEPAVRWALRQMVVKAKLRVILKVARQERRKGQKCMQLLCSREGWAESLTVIEDGRQSGDIKVARISLYPAALTHWHLNQRQASQGYARGAGRWGAGEVGRQDYPQCSYLAEPSAINPLNAGGSTFRANNPTHRPIMFEYDGQLVFVACCHALPAKIGDDQAAGTEIITQIYGIASKMFALILSRILCFGFSNADILGATPSLPRHRPPRKGLTLGTTYYPSHVNEKHRSTRLYAILEASPHLLPLVRRLRARIEAAVLGPLSKIKFPNLQDLVLHNILGGVIEENSLAGMAARICLPFAVTSIITRAIEFLDSGDASVLQNSWATITRLKLDSVNNYHARFSLARFASLTHLEIIPWCHSTVPGEKLAIDQLLASLPPTNHLMFLTLRLIFVLSNVDWQNKDQVQRTYSLGAALARASLPALRCIQFIASGPYWRIARDAFVEFDKRGQLDISVF